MKKILGFIASIMLVGIATAGFVSPQRSVVNTNVIEPSFYDVAGLGSVSNYDVVNVVGFNGDVDAAEDVRSYGGDYTYISTTGALLVSSSVNTDTGSLSIEGLDVNGAKQTVSVSLSGTTPVEVSGVWTRVFDAKYTASSSQVLSGTAYVYTTGTVTAGVPQTAATVKASMTADTNVSLKGLYTIPASSYGLIDEVYAGVYNSTGNADVTLFVREYGKNFVTKILLSPSLYMNNAGISYKVPLYIAPRSDIKLRVTGVTATNADVYGQINLKVLR